MKPLLVGECNPYGGDPYFALYPAPNGCSGHRLCHLVLGMDPDDYLDTFDRVNLCAGKWSAPAARKQAIAICGEYRGSLKVLLGSKVAAAFGVPFRPLEVFDWQTTEFTPDGPMTIRGGLLVLPHPSGRNRHWVDWETFVKAREAVAAFLPDIAHLLGR